MSAIHPATDDAPLGAEHLAAYLRHTGVTGPIRDDLPSLRRLVAGHVTSIPFEALDAYTGRAPGLGADDLVGKLVHGHRGGWCFEHSYLFRRALGALGFRTTALSARMLWGEPPDGPPTAPTHKLLRIDLPDASYIADVGVGGNVPGGPLRLEHGVEQDTSLGSFRLFATPDDGSGAGVTWRLETLAGGTWWPMYTFTPAPAPAIDFEMSNHYLAHHPGSPFRARLIASLPGADRRTNLADRRLTVRHTDGPDERTELDSPTAVRDALESRFGIDTSGVDGLDTRLRTLFEGS